MTIRPHERFQGLLPLYALGALDGTEKAVLEDHLLSGCSRCRSTLGAYETVASFLHRLVLAPSIKFVRRRVVRRAWRVRLED